MRVAVVSFGTEGDTRPFVALARALHEAGHEMILATDPGALPEDAAATPGLTVLPLDGGIRGQLADSPMGDFVREGSGVATGIGVVRHLLEDHLADWTLAFVEAARDADVLVSSGLALSVAFIAAERLRRPAVLAMLQPFEPTRDFALPTLGRELPGALRMPVARLAAAATWRALRGPVNRARAGVDLPPMRHTWTDVHQLIAVSPTLLPRPRDWSDRIVISGDWPLPLPAGFRPPADVHAFLEAGEPPVYVGFGSMPVTRAVLSGVLAGLDGRRALLAGGWAGTSGIDLPGNVIAIPHVPHAWLFPRVSAAVHHCGAGTTHAACRAGIPSVPVPMVADQPFWAARMRAVGVATAPLARRSVTADRVRIALEEAEGLRDNAIRVAERMAPEDGTSTAIAALAERATG